MKKVRPCFAQGFRAIGRGPVAVAVGVGSLLFAGVSAQAHQFPVGCTTNALTVSISRPSPIVNVGDEIPFTVALEVPDTFGTECQATGIVVRFFPPNDPPDGLTPCNSTNGTVLMDDMGEMSFDLNPGDPPVLFVVADNPILSYIVDLADVNASGGVQAFACGQGVSHTAPGDPDTAEDNREITTFVNNPAIKVEKTADPTAVCAGDDTDVTFTYQVMWDDMATPPGDTDLENVMISSPECGPIVRGLDVVGNNDDILEEFEIWQYTCTTTVNGATICTVSVSGDDVDTGLTVTNDAQAEVTELADPTCTISGMQQICPGAQNEMYTVTTDPGATVMWTITGDATFCDGTTDAVGLSVCVNTDTVCGGSFMLNATTSLGECEGECSLTVNLIDDVDPIIECPGGVTVQCIADIPDPDTGLVICTDNCAAPDAVTIEHVGDVPSGTTCPLIITRTYRCTDECGNFSDCTQIITVDDTTNPIITCPGDVSVQCIDDIPDPDVGSVICSDNCSDVQGLTVTHEGDVPSGTTCPLIITRTYRCTDECGNFAECTQTITVDDTTDPVITCPSNVTVQCIADVPPVDTGSVICSDNCSLVGGLVVTHEGDTPLTDPCGGTIERTYRCTDECGNFDECVQIITVSDTTDPIITCPGNVTVQCIDEVPAVDLGAVTCTDNCTLPGNLVTELVDEQTAGTCPTIVTRTFRCTDECGNFDECTQTITVNDTTDPQITCPGNLTVDCLSDVPPVDLGALTCTDNCTDPGDLVTELVSENESGDCPIVITRTFRCTDECGNFAECQQQITVDDDIPPIITCPPDFSVGDNPLPAVDDTLALVLCTDNCGRTTITHVGDQITELCPSGIARTIVRTYQCTDGCNTVQCSHTLTRDCPETPDEICCGEKGSLVIFSKVEIRWDGDGDLVQDTFLALTNDWDEDVAVQMYFVNGDAPLPADGDEPAHPGWNHVSAEITLTKNESAYWSAFSGQPKGVPPFNVLDPGGRPDPVHGGRVLRGFVIAWAVNSANQEIRWNHLMGSGVVLHFGEPSAWEYRACSFKVVVPVANGEQTGFDPGVLNLDGLEYSQAGDKLLLDFYSAISMPFDTGPSSTSVESTLTLHPISTDLRQEDLGPITTKAKIDVWNENEVKFNGLERCITCWDCTLLEHYAGFGIPNNFLYSTIQTDKGKARIDGVQSQNCDFDFNPVDGPLGFHPLDVVSQDAALLGLTSKHIQFGADIGRAAAGTMLICYGDPEDATIRYDVLGSTPESTESDTDSDIMDELLETIGTELGEIDNEVRRANR